MHLDLPGRIAELAIGDYVSGELTGDKRFKGFVAEIVSLDDSEEILTFSLRPSPMSMLTGDMIAAYSVRNNIVITRRSE